MLFSNLEIFHAQLYAIDVWNVVFAELQLQVLVFHCHSFKKYCVFSVTSIISCDLIE